MFNRFLRGTLGTTAAETDVAQAAEVYSNGTTQIVDVREPKEWAGGHIPGAIHIPLGHLAQRKQKLDPERPVITVCHSGSRSLAAAKILSGGGFGDVKSLAGGMKAWIAAGQPVER